jgi:twitching motility protein PilT
MAAIDTLLAAMVEAEGSDLHLKVGSPPRARIHGRLQALAREPLAAAALTTMLTAACGERAWEAFTEQRDYDFAYAVDGLARFRANYHCCEAGVAAVFRLIPNAIASLTELQAPPVLSRICELPSGLVLITGPTGSGKSTTLAAMLDHINRHAVRRIVTIEDPVEFLHTDCQSAITHCEVGRDAPTYAAALRGALRVDVDVIMLGELRGVDTMRLALDSAGAGSLVFATLHTNGAAKTISRLVDAFPGTEQPQARALLADGLAAVVSQALCRTADGQGRVAVHEVLLRTSALPSIIRDGQLSALQSLMEAGSQLGMTTMDAGLRALLVDGGITPLEAYMKATDKAAFRRYLPAHTVLG